MKQQIQIIINWERDTEDSQQTNEVIENYFLNKLSRAEIEIREGKEIIDTALIRRGCLIWTLEDVDLNASRLDLDISNMTDDVKLSIIEEAIDDNNDSVCESINDSICSIIDRTLNGTKP